MMYEPTSWGTDRTIGIIVNAQDIPNISDHELTDRIDSLQFNRRRWKMDHDTEQRLIKILFLRNEEDADKIAFPETFKKSMGWGKKAAWAGAGLAVTAAVAGYVAYKATGGGIVGDVANLIGLEGGDLKTMFSAIGDVGQFASDQTGLSSQMGALKKNFTSTLMKKYLGLEMAKKKPAANPKAATKKVAPMTLKSSGVKLTTAQQLDMLRYRAYARHLQQRKQMLTSAGLKCKKTESFTNELLSHAKSEMMKKMRHEINDGIGMIDIFGEEGLVNQGFDALF